MNYSNFINVLRQDYDVDFNQVWKKAIYSKGDKNISRAFSDEVESEFWEEYSEKYDEIPSLYDYAPYTFKKLLTIMGQNKRLLEFGCGTGKFTLPMAKVNSEIIAVDFSEHMLSKLSKNLKKNNIDNVTLYNSKFENVIINEQVDCVYCVNANYRIIDIQSAIEKMNNLARERVVIVWTMQRNMYDQILNRTEKKGIYRRQEYIHLVNVLYQMGIDASVEILDVNKPILIEDIEKNYKEINNICQEYELDYEYVKKEFDQCICHKDNTNIYNCKLKVVYIHFEPIIL